MLFRGFIFLVRERFVHANAIRFHVVEDGPDDGPLVLLLHGFPEFWYSWRHQLPALAARGLHACAPDLRGYNLSDKPSGLASYDIEVLARDVAELVGALGAERAAIVGHDWGGAIAWQVAMSHPERVTRLAVLSCPHPFAIARALIRSRAQRRRSWYFFFFQLPLLPERRLSGDGIRVWIRGWGGRMGESDLDRYVDAFAQPGALTAAINYYRAALGLARRSLRARPPKVQAPALVIWGAQDRILGLELTQDLERWMAAPVRLEILADAGHFVQQDAPDEVSRLLCEFL